MSKNNRERMVLEAIKVKKLAEEGLNTTEIGKIINRTPNTVRQIASRNNFSVNPKEYDKKTGMTEKEFQNLKKSVAMDPFNIAKKRVESLNTPSVLNTLAL